MFNLLTHYIYIYMNLREINLRDINWNPRGFDFSGYINLGDIGKESLEDIITEGIMKEVKAKIKNDIAMENYRKDTPKYMTTERGRLPYDSRLYDDSPHSRVTIKEIKQSEIDKVYNNTYKTRVKNFAKAETDKLWIDWIKKDRIETIKTAIQQRTLKSISHTDAIMIGASEPIKSMTYSDENNDQMYVQVLIGEEKKSVWIKQTTIIRHNDTNIPFDEFLLIRGGNKRKTNKRKTNKRKTNKRKTNKRKTNKRKTNKNISSRK